VFPESCRNPGYLAAFSPTDGLGGAGKLAANEFIGEGCVT
jgi:hypothetical protein